MWRIDNARQMCVMMGHANVTLKRTRAVVKVIIAQNCSHLSVLRLGFSNKGMCAKKQESVLQTAVIMKSALATVKQVLVASSCFRRAYISILVIIMIPPVLMWSLGQL